MKFIKRHFCEHEYEFRRAIRIRKHIYPELEYEYKCKCCGKKITIDPFEIEKLLRTARHLIRTMPTCLSGSWIMLKGETFYLNDLSDNSYLEFREYDMSGGLSRHRGKYVDAVKQYYKKEIGVDLDEITEYWKLTRE